MFHEAGRTNKQERTGIDQGEFYNNWNWEDNPGLNVVDNAGVTAMGYPPTTSTRKEKTRRQLIRR